MSGLDHTLSNDLKSRYRSFFEMVEGYFSLHSREMIADALLMADQHLDGKTRFDGTPLLDHSVNTARIVISEIGLGRNSTISTLLHDVVRMGLMDAKEVGHRFGEECTGVIQGLCNISDVHLKTSKQQADNFRDLIVSYSGDPRVILIKLADRLEVMRSLAIFPEVKRRKKSWESLNLYAQIAHKLGLYAIKSELEDISLSYLETKDYLEIKSRLEEGSSRRELFISRFLDPVEEKFKQAKLKYTIKSRTKSIYSIWNKMRKMSVSFDEIYDIFALRVIIDCPLEQEKPTCWMVYSIFTDFYTPNPDRMRDWISIPKSNGYESLHTTVVTDNGQWVEIQIRTERMDAVAERGIAAHWRYKGVNKGGMGSEEWLGKLREIMETTTPDNIAHRFDAKLSSAEIFIFTPNGDLIKLPEGATVLDFAFDIHTNLGCSCTGAHINNRNVSIKEVLHNGDIVEITSSKTQRPKSDWLNIVVTHKAKSKIRAYLREESAKQAGLGREVLDRKIKNWKINITIDEAVTMLCKTFKCKTGTELYNKIAQGEIDVPSLKEIIINRINNPSSPEIKIRPTIPAVKKVVGSGGNEMFIDGELGNMEYKFAKCCNPIFGDNVFGFVTIASGITIHREDCPNAARLKGNYPYRVLEINWRRKDEQGSFLVSIRVVAEDTPGMTNRVVDVMSRDLKLNIRSMNMNSSGGTLEGVINVEVSGSGMVDMVIHSIIRIKGVHKAHRMN